MLYFALFTFNLYTKNTKNIILSYLSDLTLVSDREGIDNPFYRVGCEVLICLCGCEGFARGLLLDWYLGSQKLREILMLLCCITLSSWREYNASSRSSKMNFWRRCPGGLCKSHITSTYHKPLSFTLHFCLSFSSPPLHPCRFICPSSAVCLSFAFFLFACVLLACLSSCLAHLSLSTLPRVRSSTLNKGSKKT